ncbi:MAG: Mov34/MPN/PAD-1 family protein [Bryobacterales bacterium]|nr:Mov34/MPN/PAD-1 family protein [Bryobacterales bacterium]
MQDDAPNSASFDLGAPEIDFIALEMALPREKVIFWESTTAKDAGTGDIDIVVTQYVLLQVAAHLAESDKENGGFLLGNRYRCPVSKREYIVIDECCRAKYTESTNVSVSFPPESWAVLNSDLNMRFRGKELVGWYHSHPNIEIFLSPQDLVLHGQYFSEPFKTAMVVDPIRNLGGFFGCRKGVLDGRMPLPFYELLEGRALEQRRTAMQWKHYLSFDAVTGKTLRRQPVEELQKPRGPVIGSTEVVPETTKSFNKVMAAALAGGLAAMAWFFWPAPEPRMRLIRAEARLPQGANVQDGLEVWAQIENAASVSRMEARVSEGGVVSEPLSLHLIREDGKEPWFKVTPTPKTLQFKDQSAFVADTKTYDLRIVDRKSPEASQSQQIQLEALRYKIQAMLIRKEADDANRLAEQLRKTTQQQTRQAQAKLEEAREAAERLSKIAQNAELKAAAAERANAAAARTRTVDRQPQPSTKAVIVDPSAPAKQTTSQTAGGGQHEPKSNMVGEAYPAASSTAKPEATPPKDHNPQTNDDKSKPPLTAGQGTPSTVSGDLVSVAGQLRNCLKAGTPPKTCLENVRGAIGSLKTRLSLADEKIIDKKLQSVSDPRTLRRFANAFTGKDVVGLHLDLAKALEGIARRMQDAEEKSKQKLPKGK